MVVVEPMSDLTQMLDEQKRECERLRAENQELKLSTVNRVADDLVITGLQAQVKELRGVLAARDDTVKLLSLEEERLRAALERYARHDHSCTRYQSFTTAPCTCGLIATLRPNASRGDF